MATNFPITAPVLDHILVLTPNRKGNFWRGRVVGERLTFFGRTQGEVKYKAFLHLGGDA